MHLKSSYRILFVCLFVSLASSCQPKVDPEKLKIELKQELRKENQAELDSLKSALQDEHRALVKLNDQHNELKLLVNQFVDTLGPYKSAIQSLEIKDSKNLELIQNAQKTAEQALQRKSSTPSSSSSGSTVKKSGNPYSYPYKSDPRRKK